MHVGLRPTPDGLVRDGSIPPSELPPCDICGATDTDLTFLTTGNGTFDFGVKQGQPCWNGRLVCESHVE